MAGRAPLGTRRAPPARGIRTWDAAGLAVVILAAAAGVALVLTVAAVFIQAVR